MPLYEYQCPSCGNFEVIQKFSDKPVKKCPTCGKKVEKLASAPAFQFKGTGWYVTDYAKKSGGPDSKSDKPAAESKSEPKAASSDSAASTSKADPKPESTAKKGKSKDAA